MARRCPVTGKRPMVGHHVSHANNKTRRRYLPNLHVRRIWIESENRAIRVRISNAALRLMTRKAPMLYWPVCARAAKSEESCMAKGRREKIKLESSAGSGHFYTTTKNKRIKPDKLKLMKFDPSPDVRKHVLYTETKLK